ncbi:protein kinase domain-containing protein [Desulfosediminicola sp.]|uniref:protein kinase domain-containing protein n=1 Tax=Desulfosediminicola sp. TaxID=2886825 RepID=UPI003AF2FC1F
MSWENNRLPMNVASSPIGNGTFGQVFPGADIIGNDLAVKYIQYSNEAEARHAVSEGISLNELEHENVVKVHHVSLKEPNYVAIATEMCNQGDLDSFFKNNLMSTQMAKVIFMEMAHGLKYIHSKCYIHRDIKPQNIFMKDNKPKIGDLGLAYKTSNGFAQGAGTPIFMAKETLEHNLCSFQTDIWSFGLTVYWLLVGQNLYCEFAKNYNQDVRSDRIGNRLIFLPHINRWWGVFIKRCINVDVDARFKNMNEVTHDLSNIPANNWVYNESLKTWNNIGVRAGRRYEASLKGSNVCILNHPINGGNTMRICNKKFGTEKEAGQFLRDYFYKNP